MEREGDMIALTSDENIGDQKVARFNTLAGRQGVFSHEWNPDHR